MNQTNTKPQTPCVPPQRLSTTRLLGIGREPDPFDRIAGTSREICKIKALLNRIARSPASTVLISGESGTGKGLAARAIHEASERADGSFVSINCSALPPGLLESELFGHERGAFTDAKERKKGLVEAAKGGTLFLDELGEMDLGLQAKLLHFLDHKSFRRVGGCVDIQADVRVVAATNVDLMAAIADRRFRRDLYYRMAVLMVELPPLRERPEDIREIVSRLLRDFAEELNLSPRRVSPMGLRWLQAQPWPGNVRELKNTIERAVLLSPENPLCVEDLTLAPPAHDPIEARASDTFELPPEGVDLRTLERSLVAQALGRTGGNITHAGRLLGLSRDQVRYRIEKFSLRVHTSPDS
ncbi:Nitrogen fixation protein VnfA [Enhygromyxa salina]|uniref:Nitrogen fixation protein VnfA n=1 Tax=Enhygromyxa salina TaxID=215803 RepID=A0A2S9XE69_9BACT|nr:sigma 54-interacting transcriptional regulator [Enhygromyxa salina]PRP91159.1 Nitrogen fixation protein VnfA [Enhygromyxa salina]